MLQIKQIHIRILTCLLCLMKGYSVLAQCPAVDTESPFIMSPHAQRFECEKDLPPPAADIVKFIAQGGKVTDNCPGVKITWLKDEKTRISGCNYSIVRYYVATDAAGNSSMATQSISINDNTPPAWETAVYSLDKTVDYSNKSGIDAALAMSPKAIDNCSEVTYEKKEGKFIPDPSCPQAGKIRNTWTVKDKCDNILSEEFLQTITITNNIPPKFDCPPSSSSRLLGIKDCNYLISGGEFNIRTQNPEQLHIEYHISGATSQSGNNSLDGIKLNTGISTITWTVTDRCSNVSSCSFSVTIKDPANNSSYMIYATTEARFGEDSINGDIGVSAIDGKVQFAKTNIPSPYKVVAANISGVTVKQDNKTLKAASDGPNPEFIHYNGSGGNDSYVAREDAKIIGNLKELTVKENVSVILEGDDFGIINLESGADLTFTSNSINLVELNVGSGKKDEASTFVHFKTASTVKVRDRVKIGSDCNFNSDGYRVTFYLENPGKDKEEENFTVKTDNSFVILNLVMRGGKLKLTGGERAGSMTGWYILNKLESDGKNISWNKLECH